MKKTTKIDEATLKVYRVLLERFGDAIGESPACAGVTDERCSESDDDDDDLCEIEIVDEKSGGMSKKGAQSWVKGTKTFKDKVNKARKAGMKDPEGFAAWVSHKASGKWPSEE